MHQVPPWDREAGTAKELRAHRFIKGHIRALEIVKELDNIEKSITGKHKHRLRTASQFPDEAESPNVLNPVHLLPQKFDTAVKLLFTAG